MTRGIRNNNPLNLRRGEKWQGLSLRQTDRFFCQFREMRYGIRAAIIVIRTYYITYGLRTIRLILERFAPACENDTCAYINAVSAALRVSPDKELFLDFYDFSFHSFLYALLRSMSMIESNYELSIDLFRESLSLIGEPQMHEYQRCLRLHNSVVSCLENIGHVLPSSPDKE